MSDELIDRIIEQRRALDRTIRQRVMDPWMSLSLTMPQMRCMFHISRMGKMNLSTLAAGVKVTPANVTGIVDRLVEQGYLSRTADASDRRVLWIDLTGKGKTLVDELREIRHSEMKNILRNLTQDELTTIATGYDLLIKACEGPGNKRTA